MVLGHLPHQYLLMRICLAESSRSVQLVEEWWRRNLVKTSYPGNPGNE